MDLEQGYGVYVSPPDGEDESFVDVWSGSLSISEDDVLRQLAGLSREAFCADEPIHVDKLQRFYHICYGINDSADFPRRKVKKKDVISVNIRSEARPIQHNAVLSADSKNQICDLLMDVNPPSVKSPENDGKGDNDEEIPSEIDEYVEEIAYDWKSIGFQTGNPATDFRGGGVLALDHMLYLAEYYPKECRKMMIEAQDTPGSNFYLYCAACINVSMLLVVHLAIRDDVAVSHPQATKYIRKRMFRMMVKHDPKAVLSELFCVTMMKLHTLWQRVCAEKNDATILDFGEALRLCNVSVRALLNQIDFRSVSEFNEIDIIIPSEMERWNSYYSCRDAVRAVCANILSIFGGGSNIHRRRASVRPHDS